MAILETGPEKKRDGEDFGIYVTYMEESQVMLSKCRSQTLYHSLSIYTCINSLQSNNSQFYSTGNHITINTQCYLDNLERKTESSN